MRLPINWDIVWSCYFAIMLSACLLVGTGLVGGWKLWYGDNRQHHEQVEAFFRGELSVGRDPSAVRHDYTWVNGQANQVWGLGVPALRFPFEAAARLFGQNRFPDRLVFGFYYALLALAAFRIYLLRPVLESNANLGELLQGLVSVSFILLSPGFVTLCMTRFAVWEETVAYTVLAGLGQFVWLQSLWERPGRFKFLLLAAFAGLAPMIRPTALFYSIPTLLLACWRMRREPLAVRTVSAGAALFVLAGMLLFFTNWKRFGSGFEFGHRINVTEVHSLYLTRFENPYRLQPAWTAAAELVGAIFLVSEINGFNFFQTGFFPGQANAPRWREFYFTTFGPWEGLLLATSWLFTLVLLFKKKGPLPAEWISAWSFASFALLFGFYLWVPALTSRYVMDFLPAITIGIVHLVQRLFTRVGPRRILSLMLFLAFETMLVVGIFSSEINSSHSNRPLTAWQGGRLASTPAILPEYYSKESPPPRLGGGVNGRGWSPASGVMGPTVTLFCADPEFIELELEAKESAGPSDLQHFRARIALEELKKVGITTLENGRYLLRFAPPRRPANQKGVQLLFLATMPGENVGVVSRSDFKLLRVSWKKLPEKDPDR